MTSPEPYPRVLHVIASLAIGGTERQLVGFVQRSSAPTQHHFALFDEPGPLAEIVPNSPHVIGSVSRDLRSTGSNLRTVRSLRSLIRSLDVDLVHAHLDLSQILAALATPRSVAVVASRRGRNVGVMARPWLRPVEGLAHRRTAVLICNSEYLADRTRTRDLWPPLTQVIHNAVDVDWFTQEPFPPGPPTIAMVANAHPYKRHDRFLEAFRIVLQQIPEARAVLVGGGPDLATVRDAAHRMGVGSEVELVGQVEDSRPFLMRSHVVALASDHEGFPNVLLEAMATGRPVVSTSVGGVPELVRDGVDGLLVPRDARALGEALVRVAGDLPGAEQMGAEARRRAEEFGWDRVVRETESVYAGVLENPRR
jgi:glycosyltransferase involved in cell wall biosynthesis